ncbi:MAG: MipA/OmpV family protein [Rhodospirillaceae bacterium]|nr:MipA/OmpV family protein [Rhodospirillaceae bacterium]
MIASRIANAAIASLFALFASGAAFAQDFQRVTTRLTDTLQTAIDLLPPGVNGVRLGIGPGVYPDFEGSRHSSVHAVPVVSLRYRDMIEVINNEVKVTAFNHLFTSVVSSDRAGGSLRVGPLVSLNFGHGEKDSPDLKGMGNVGTSIELGAFASFLLPDDRFRARLRQDVAGGHKGATLQLDYTHTFIRGTRMSLSGTLGLDGASAAYMKSFFGVNPIQAARSGLPAYRAATGFKDVNAGMNGSYTLTDKWTVFGTVNYERLVGSAANSPLIRLRGDRNNVTASTFFVYGF